MREFQTVARAEIDRIVNAWGVHLEWNEIRIGPLAAMGYASDDVDLYT
jgi:hypothetical protein